MVRVSSVIGFFLAGINNTSSGRVTLTNVGTGGKPSLGDGHTSGALPKTIGNVVLFAYTVRKKLYNFMTGKSSTRGTNEDIQKMKMLNIELITK